MIYQIKLLLFFAFFSTFWTTVESSTTAAPDPCDVNLHAAFPSSANRSVKYNSSTAINDRYIREGWYGEDHLIIPTIAPELNHCGTRYPMYLQVAPQITTTEIQEVPVCVRVGSDMCPYPWPIQVKVCSPERTVYRLLRSKVENSGYCIAPSSYNTFPDFVTTPTVRTTLEDTTQGGRPKQYRFFCDFTNADTTLFYQANWYIDGIFIHKSSFVALNEASGRSLTDADLSSAGIKTVGFYISCKLRASFSDESHAGLPSGSRKTFIGIEVINQLTLREGQAGFLKLKSTVPIGCKKDRKCVYVMALHIPPKDEDCSLTVRSDTHCGVPMKINGSTSELKLIGGVTAQYDKSSQVVEFILKSALHYLDHRIWGNYTMAPITVLVTKDTKAIEHRLCIVCCTLRIQTFNGRYMYPMKEGTFTMYENKKYNIEVQVKTFACSGNFAYCVCGLVARVGKTVFMINHCNTDHWFIDYILCGDGGDVLDIKLYGSYYKFTFPNGATMTTIIQTSANQEYLDSRINPSVVDVGETGGLCGNLTGSNYQQDDERILRDGTTAASNSDFFTSWGVSTNNSMFDADNLDAIGGLDNTVDYKTCSCNDPGITGGTLINEITCSAINGTATCVNDEEYRSVNKKRCIAPVKRRRRSLPSLYPEYNLPRRIKRATSYWTNGWTEQKATDYCNVLFNSSKMVEACKDVPGVDLVTPMASCMGDIELSGSDEFARSAVDKIRSQCLYEATMNVTLREGTADQPSVLQQVKEVACPGECSKHGQCNKGACTCNDGYIGSDCSVNVKVKLLAAGLEADGYCDLTDDKCQEIAVFGGTFIESSDFKCRLDPFQVDRSGTVTPKASVTMVGLVESIGEVTCPLPVRSRRRRRSSVVIPVVDDTLTGYSVSVSNNGNIYSDSLTMVITNSRCINCSINSGTVTCTFSDNYCFTDGRCYSNNEQHLINRDYVCNSGKQTWINSKKTEPVLSLLVIVGICVAAVLVVIIVLVVVVIVIRKSSKSNTVM